MEVIEALPLNCAARNATWSYSRLAPPRFRGAPAIVEPARSYRRPDFSSLPEQSDVAVDLYGGTLRFRLDGLARRVYIRDYTFASYDDYATALDRFGALWEEVCRLDRADVIRETAEGWLEREIAGGPVRGSYLSWLDSQTA